MKEINNSSKLLLKIRSSFESLPSSQRAIAHYVLDDPKSAAGQVISELAISARVSDATVTRFCLALGLSGYPEFRKLLIQEITSFVGDTAHGAKSSSKEGPNISAFYQGIGYVDCTSGSPQLSSAVKRLVRADKVMLTGLGPLALLGEFLFLTFSPYLPSLRSGSVIGLQTAGRQLESYGKRDAIMLLASPHESNLQNLIDYSHSREIDIFIPYIPKSNDQCTSEESASEFRVDQYGYNNAISLLNATHLLLERVSSGRIRSNVTRNP